MLKCFVWKCFMFLSLSCVPMVQSFRLYGPCMTILVRVVGYVIIIALVLFTAITAVSFVLCHNLNLNYLKNNCKCKHLKHPIHCIHLLLKCKINPNTVSIDINPPKPSDLSLWIIFDIDRFTSKFRSIFTYTSRKHPAAFYSL